MDAVFEDGTGVVGGAAARRENERGNWGSVELKGGGVGGAWRRRDWARVSVGPGARERCDGDVNNEGMLVWVRGYCCKDESETGTRRA